MEISMAKLIALIKALAGGGGGGAVDDVKVNGTSVVTDGVAEIPLANSSNPGVVKVGANGITLNSSDLLSPQIAIESDVKAGTTTTRLQIPANQHAAAFYGLAKAAGDSTQSASANAVGQYTEAAKSAIRAMLGARSRDWVLLQTEVVAADDTQSVEFVIPDGVLALRVHCVASNISAGRNVKFIFNALDRNVFFNNFQTSSQKNVMLTIGENACGYRDIAFTQANDAETNIPLVAGNMKTLNCDYYFGGNSLSSLTLTTVATPWNTGDTITVYGLK